MVEKVVVVELGVAAGTVDVGDDDIDTVDCCCVDAGEEE
jgi:hypothetical protein